MQIARLSIERPLYTWILILFCLFGGAAGYLSVGKLEDPTFTLKSGLIITPYPGATAAEVAIEVSEVLEAEIQQMDEVDFITSTNTPGLSVIEVNIQDTYDGTELPQVWDDMRDRVTDAIPDLPPGALAPTVNDSFGDVYGLLYAVSAPGYSDATVWDIATFLRRELLTVNGVANAGGSRFRRTIKRGSDLSRGATGCDRRRGVGGGCGDCDRDRDQWAAGRDRSVPRGG
ncbi:MAG: efflux RND transporter permease subunit [Pseudomonadota bacterium]